MPSLTFITTGGLLWGRMALNGIRPCGQDRRRALRPPLALFVMAAFFLSNVGGAVQAQSPTDHPYFPDDFQVTEGQGSARISVVRDAASADVTVTYASKPSDAREGADFLPVRGQLTFPANDRGPKTFDVAIIDDGEPEEEESLLLILYDAGGNAIDFSELVIHSNEAIPADPDEGPGSGPGAAGPQTEPGSSGPSRGPGAAGPNPGGTGQPAGPPGTVGQPPPAPADAPTILLLAKPAAGKERDKPGNQGPRSLAADQPGPGALTKVVLALSALGLLGGGAALLWLRARENRPAKPKGAPSEQ